VSLPVTRDVTVAVFVTRCGSATDAAVGGSNAYGTPDGSGAHGAASGDEPRVLLHEHARLGRWLPPGGHIEPNEIPDEAALREVLEETGLTVELIGDQIDIPSLPGETRQLTRPAGVQVVSIAPGHEHVDLVYLAHAAPDAEPTTGRWLTRADLDHPALRLTAEVKAWCAHALGRYEDED